MPRCYVTLEQKRKANFEKQGRMENALVGSEIKSAMKKINSGMQIYVE